MKKILIVLLALTALGLTGVLMFRHFVTDQITDRGGMENPDAGSEEEQLLDGDGTYAANELLRQRIVGAWESTDGRWTMTLGEDDSIAVTLDGDTVLEDALEFTYLQPGEVRQTELRLRSCDYTLRRTDGSTVGEIFAIHHEVVEDDNHGKICMALADMEAHRETIQFRQHNPQ